MKKYCQVIHIIAHTQMCWLPLCQKAYLRDISSDWAEGYHHTTKINKIYKVNQGYFIKQGKLINNNASTDYDASDKNINPLGDFVRYSDMTNDFVMLKDCVIGTKKQVLTCKSLLMQTKCFQAVEDKKAFMGPLKKDRITEEEGA
ncbi:unnamed protein product [Rangifer tarandus platyrhynchus]|uniref:Uncharacterized protein n=1 Tax=Rangifer tarandus platyrhynchus TaxID=3082113 RepID=A0AC59YXC8_RANTA